MDAGLLLSAIALAGLGIALGCWLLVPHPAVPLGSLREVNARRRDAQLSVLWEEAAWPESGYVASPLGQTHYYFLGPLDGEPLVFVHGITAGSPCFPDLIEGLAAAGFRVMTYDLYGRGFSASPGVHYDEGLYTTQLLLTVRALGWSNFHLVGLSLGGGIASSFSSQFPDMVKTLSLIAPAGLLSGLPPVATLLQTPWIGPILWHGLGRKFIIRLSERNYVQAKTPSLQVKRTMAMTRYLVEHHPGVMRAYYSTVQHFPLCGMNETYRKLENLLSGRVGVVLVFFYIRCFC